MTPEILTGLVALVGLIGAVFGYWRYFESRIGSARDKIDEQSRDLAAYKLHVAESYVTKSGMKEIRDEILGAVGGLREDLRHLSSRIDTMHEAQNKSRPARRTGD